MGTQLVQLLDFGALDRPPRIFSLQGDDEHIAGWKQNSCASSPPKAVWAQKIPIYR